MDSSPLVWPFGVKGKSEDWGHLVKDFVDDQGLRFFGSGPVCQEPIQRQLCLLRKTRKRFRWLWKEAALSADFPRVLKGLTACTA